MRRVAAVLVVVTWAIAAGCGGGGGGSDEGPSGPGLQATLRSSTLFETRRAFSLTLEPSGDRDLRIDAIQLRTPLFEDVRPQSRDALVRATERAVVMPLRFGEPRCDARADGPAELVTDVDGEDVRLPLDEVPEDLLAERHAEECAVAEVLEDVDIRFGDRWERIRPRAFETDLELVQRRPGVTATVDEFLGNVIFTVEPADPGLEVGDGRRSDSVPVVIDASRCDPHALIEYKRKFLLQVWAQVGDADPVLVDVEAVGPGRRALEVLLAACAG